MIEVLAKGLGKNVDEAVVKKWFVAEGDPVTEGEDLVELETEGATIPITAPASGILAEVCFDKDETVQRDEVLCMIDDEEADFENDDEDEEEDGEER